MRYIFSMCAIVCIGILVCSAMPEIADASPSLNVRFRAHSRHPENLRRPPDTPCPESFRGRLIFADAVAPVVDLSNLNTQKPWVVGIPRCRSLWCGGCASG
jgi:hypothetical protein